MDAVHCASCGGRIPLEQLSSSACPHCGKDVRGKRTKASAGGGPRVATNSRSTASRFAGVNTSSDTATDDELMTTSPFAWVPPDDVIVEAPSQTVAAHSESLPVISRYDDSHTELMEDMNSPPATSSWLIHIGPRTLRYSIYFGGWLGPPLLLLLPILWGEWGFCCPFIVIGLPWYALGHWPVRWLTPLITSIFITKLRCACCHEVYSPVGRWTCGCGYTDYRERNVFEFKCPLCRQRMGRMQCLRCDATILF